MKDDSKAGLVSPWVLNRLYVDGQVLRFAPLETWWTDFDAMVTNWKSTRYYVDARDVEKESFPHHPAHWIGRDHPRLTELLEHTPIFALGSDPHALERFRKRGARVYAVGFVRTADDFLEVAAWGPSLSRQVAGPLQHVEAAVRMRKRGHRELPTRLRGEMLIDRIMRAISEGQFSQRSLDLAEIWSALSGGPSMFLFDEEGRIEYIRMLESAFTEIRARGESQRELVERIREAIDQAEQSNEKTVELPELGRADRQVLPAIEIEGTAGLKPGSVDGVSVEWDGRAKAKLPAEHQWVLRVSPEAFVPSARRVWLEKTRERHRRRVLRDTAKREAQATRERNKLLIILACVIAATMGGCLYLTRKPSYGAPCEKGDDCRSGLCRKIDSGPGLCVATCGRGCWRGTKCVFDADLGTLVCVPVGTKPK